MLINQSSAYVRSVREVVTPQPSKRWSSTGRQKFLPGDHGIGVNIHPNWVITASTSSVS